jgi:hypothetical protein
LKNFNLQSRLAVSRRFAVCGMALLLTAGCNRMADTSANFSKAINKYYSTRPTCLWPQPIKFPVEENVSDVDKAAPFDALVNEGLLTRTVGEKKDLLVITKQVLNYDLTSKGRSVWVADPSEPGTGNFCYGHRKVEAIDSSTPTSGTNGATTVVVYMFKVTGAPGWAKVPAIQQAFPGMRDNLNGQLSQATLTDTAKGWTVTSAPNVHISDSPILQ